MGVGRRAALGLGSNIGDRHKFLQLAVDCLSESEGVDIVAISPVYETDPVGGPEQGAFLNAVIAVEVDITADGLLMLCQQCETRAGRARAERWGPRTLDVDILGIAGVRQHTVSLTLPHPRALERAFVLIPWADVDPGFEISDGVTVADAAQLVDHSGVRATDQSLSVTG